MATLEAYLHNLPRRLAELKLVELGPSMAPHVRPRDYKRMVRAWEKALAPRIPPAPVVDGGFFATLALMGIGVTHVPRSRE